MKMLKSEFLEQLIGTYVNKLLNDKELAPYIPTFERLPQVTELDKIKEEIAGEMVNSIQKTAQPLLELIKIVINNTPPKQQTSQQQTSQQQQTPQQQQVSQQQTPQQQQQTTSQQQTPSPQQQQTPQQQQASQPQTTAQQQAPQQQTNQQQPSQQQTTTQQQSQGVITEEEVRKRLQEVRNNITAEQTRIRQTVTKDLIVAKLAEHIAPLKIKITNALPDFIHVQITERLGFWRKLRAILLGLLGGPARRKRAEHVAMENWGKLMTFKNVWDSAIKPIIESAIKTTSELATTYNNNCDNAIEALEDSLIKLYDTYTQNLNTLLNAIEGMLDYDSPEEIVKYFAKSIIEFHQRAEQIAKRIVSASIDTIYYHALEYQTKVTALKETMKKVVAEKLRTPNIEHLQSIKPAQLTSGITSNEAARLMKEALPGLKSAIRQLSSNMQGKTPQDIFQQLPAIYQPLMHHIGNSLHPLILNALSYIIAQLTIMQDLNTRAKIDTIYNDLRRLMAQREFTQSPPLFLDSYVSHLEALYNTIAQKGYTDFNEFLVHFSDMIQTLKPYTWRELQSRMGLPTPSQQTQQPGVTGRQGGTQIRKSIKVNIPDPWKAAKRIVRQARPPKQVVQILLWLNRLTNKEREHLVGYLQRYWLSVTKEEKKQALKELINAAKKMGIPVN